jgi:hypothetical protein
MKNEPHKLPLTEEAARQEDTTPEFGAGAGRRAHRRMTVTVERETLSIFMRRPVVGAAAANVAANVNQPAGAESAPEPSGKDLPTAPENPS